MGVIRGRGGDDYSVFFEDGPADVCDNDGCSWWRLAHAGECDE